MDHFAEYQAYNDLLLRFIVDGQGDSEAADSVRDLMDNHWYKMTEKEQELSRKINKKPLS